MIETTLQKINQGMPLIALSEEEKDCALKMLKDYPEKITQINLAHFPITDEAKANAIASKITSCSNLTHLSLAYCQLTKERAKKIFLACIWEQGGKKLEVVDLSYNYFQSNQETALEIIDPWKEILNTDPKSISTTFPTIRTVYFAPGDPTCT